MTDRHTPFDDHEKRRLDPTGDACVDLPVGAIDLLDASPVECRSNGDHGEASLGRHLGHQHGVSANQSPRTNRAKPYCREAKGECCERIGRKLDKLLDEIRSDEPFSSEDPPEPDQGGKAERCADEPAADGGVSGFTLPPEPEPTPAPQAQTIEEPFAMAWDCHCGQGQSLSDLREFLQELQDTPELSAGATLRKLTRIQWELERSSDIARLNDPIPITLRDAAGLMSQMLSRLHWWQQRKGGGNYRQKPWQRNEILEKGRWSQFTANSRFHSDEDNKAAPKRASASLQASPLLLWS